MRRALPPALALLAVAWAAILFVDPWAAEGRNGDIYLYEAFADLFLEGHWPYADVPFEYPPLAAPLIALPGLAGGGHDTYEAVFMLLMAAFALGLVLLCGALAQRSGGSPARAMIAAAAAPLLIGALLRTRFDLVPVVLVCAALLCLCRTRPRLAFVLLGVGTGTKLFPALVAAVAFAWLLGRGERRQALQGLAAFGATVAVVAAAALALSPAGFIDSFEYHVDRPVQIESLPAQGLLFLDRLGLGQAATEYSFRSHGVRHPADRALAAISLALMLAALAAVLLAAAREPSARHLVLASLAAVAAFTAFGKVLSPQFMIWLIPLGALALAWRMHALAALVAAAAALTLVEYPGLYGELIVAERLPLVVVGARDALLVAVVALSLRELWRRHEQLLD